MIFGVRIESEVGEVCAYPLIGTKQIPNMYVCVLLCSGNQALNISGLIVSRQVGLVYVYVNVCHNCSLKKNNFIFIQDRNSIRSWNISNCYVKFCKCELTSPYSYWRNSKLFCYRIYKFTKPQFGKLFKNSILKLICFASIHSLQKKNISKMDKFVLFGEMFVSTKEASSSFEI